MSQAKISQGTDDTLHDTKNRPEILAVPQLLKNAQDTATPIKRIWLGPDTKSARRVSIICKSPPSRQKLRHFDRRIISPPLSPPELKFESVCHDEDEWLEYDPDAFYESDDDTNLNQCEDEHIYIMDDEETMKNDDEKAQRCFFWEECHQYITADTEANVNTNSEYCDQCYEQRRQMCRTKNCRQLCTLKPVGGILYSFCHRCRTRVAAD